MLGRDMKKEEKFVVWLEKGKAIRIFREGEGGRQERKK